MNVSSANVTVVTQYQDSLSKAVVKNMIVVVLGISINYINASLFHTFSKHQIFYRNPRYILFIHLVVNDMIQVTLTIIMFIISYTIRKINVSFCCFLMLTAVFATENTPLNLACMAVECYIAVCMPLRHVQICTIRRTLVLIGLIWITSMLSVLPDLFITLATEPLDFFRSRVFCLRQTVFPHPVNIKRRDAQYSVFLVVIWITIFYTYFKILFTAKAASKDAQKARNTILLHGFQLLLCMATYVGPPLLTIIKQWFPQDYTDHLFAFYITIQILPRSISPVIYGVRDNTFRRYLKRYLCCKDIQGDDIPRDMQTHSRGIFVINKEGEENGHYDEIGIFVEGVVILENIGSVARACAMMLGVIYALNLAYPKELRHYYEFIQKVLFRMDGEKLSPKVLGLKNKIGAGHCIVRARVFEDLQDPQMNSSGFNMSSAERYRDSFQTAVVKNVIILAVGLTIGYINGTLIHTFRKHQVLNLNPRYILFIHLVVNDMIQLTTTVSLFVYSYIFYRMNASLCCLIIALAVFTTLNTPLNLAVMAMECYIAVCLPLRHAELCTVKRTYVLIGGIWALSAVSTLPDVFIFLATEPVQVFHSAIFCEKDNLFRHPMHVQKKDVYIIYLIGVWLTLFYTYVMIFTAAKSADGDAKKARNTILLHGFQLLLAMLTFVAHVFKKALLSWFPKHYLHVVFVSYIIIQILPRFVSPIVYGLRDKMFRKYLKMYILCAVRPSIKPRLQLK
ncbi:uncharacterized protein LKV04_002766 [Tautogolabrus adspersus]